MTITSEQDKTPPSSAPRWLVRSMVVSIVGLVVAALAVLLWSLPRGFDITDESFYLLNYRYPQEYEASFSTFHLVVTRALRLADCSVLSYRIAAMLATGLGATLFGWSLARWMRAEMGSTEHRWLMQPLLVVSYSLLGSLLVYSIFPRILSYNSLNSLLLLVGAAAVLAALRRGAGGAYWLLGAGIALGLDVFIKPSTAVLVGVSEILLLGWCWRRAGSKALLGAALLLLAGVGLGLGIYFFCVQKPGIWYHNFTQEMAVLKQGSGYRTADLLPSYLNDAAATLRFLLYPMGPALLGLLGLAWWWPRRVTSKSWHRLLAAGVLGIVAVLLAGAAVSRQWYSNSFSNKYETLPLLLALLLLAAGVLLVQAPAASRSNKEAERPAVGIWLFTLPFLTAAGTINDLRLNLLVDAAPWFAVIILLLVDPRLGRLPTWVAAAMLLLPAGFAAEQIVWGTLFTPYNLTQPMSRQTVPLHTAGLAGGVRVDTATAAFFSQLELLLARGGFRPGDPLLALYDTPGLVYVCGGISPGAPWYFAGRDARNCHALAITRLPVQRVCILVSKPIGTDMTNCLRTHGIPFPQGYQLLGKLLNPYAANLTPEASRTLLVYGPLKP